LEDWVLERLGTIVGKKDRKMLPALVEETTERGTFPEGDYYRVARNSGSMTKGMVITREGIVPDYPRVRRIFHLKNFITRYYYSPFYVEELLPGYHARLVRLGDSTVAFTRDGRWCPFTTDRAVDLLPEGFLEDNPDLIVCLVINGTGIPYAVEPDAGETNELMACAVDFLERDVREPLSPEEKYRLFERYHMPSVQHTGPFDPKELDGLDEWVAGIIARGGTGVVLKPSERPHRPLQYAIPPELQSPRPLWTMLAEDEAGIDTVFQRLLRASCAYAEQGVETEEISWEAVGRALFAPIIEGVQRVAAGDELRQANSVWLHHRESAEALLPHLAELDPTVVYEQVSLEPEDEGWRLDFECIYRDASEGLARRISGASYVR
jgi:putative ATP-dependent DNA ligase